MYSALKRYCSQDHWSIRTSYCRFRVLPLGYWFLITNVFEPNNSGIFYNRHWYTMVVKKTYCCKVWKTTPDRFRSYKVQRSPSDDAIKFHSGEPSWIILGFLYSHGNMVMPLNSCKGKNLISFAGNFNAWDLLWIFTL